MEKNIGDQLNKAFEAYRQVSIEKDNAKKELEQMSEHYERYTRKLQKQIQDQQQLISKLEAKLSAKRQPSGEMKCEPCNHLADGASAYMQMQHLVYPRLLHQMVLEDCIASTLQQLELHCSLFIGPENIFHQEKTDTVASSCPVNSSFDYQDMLKAFEAIQGKFRQIRSLTRRQKDHLKRFHGGSSASNDQWFSMPIQCTDRTAERPFSSPLRSAVAAPPPPPMPPMPPPMPLASRCASPEDKDLEDSLTKLSVKFPPSADSEYDFLNSAPERHSGLAVFLKRPPRGVPSTLAEEEPVKLPAPFVYPPSPTHAPSSPLSQESVRGPQQPLWSPEPGDAVDVGTELATPQSSSPDKCAFCHAVVPQDRMNSHLYSHFSAKNETDTCR